MRLSMRLQEAWRQDSSWLRVLRPVASLYQGVLFLRRQLYRRGWRQVYRAPVPVVVVGNISVGGTGKTPVVIALARAMSQRGLRVGVVSRGYGAASGAFPRRVMADSDWHDCGDEPLMIARQTGCPVVIAPRRPEAVDALLQWQAVDLVISDDGLQHLALGRDLEIVLLDPVSGIGNGRLLPAGPLREPAARLPYCDWVLQRDSAAPRRYFRYRIEGLVHLETGATRPPDAFAGKRVSAVAGIASPAAFFTSLREVGMQVAEFPFPDHHAFVPGDFSGLQKQPIIMTEKDAVKCQAFAGPDAWYLRIVAELPDALIARVLRLVDGTTQQHQG